MNYERLKSLVPPQIRDARIRRIERVNWEARQFAAPSPAYIKRQVLVRNGIPGAAWVESGTYLGDTTSMLAKSSRRVISIEPNQKLYERATKRFASSLNVEVIHGLSEEVFPRLLPQLHEEFNFWLDGHFSDGLTHKGPKETPIEDELRCIEMNIQNFPRLALLIDDLRCFNPTRPQYAAYPSLDFLVDWARANHLAWHIEHDIFVAKSHD